MKFDAPKANAGEFFGLLLGGFDDEARVWLNGKYLGSSGRKFSRPAVFDLTDAIDTQKQNVLAIQIARVSNLNENGTGGLVRPSFIFQGPRALPSSKPGDAEFRVLPGGELEKTIG